MWGFEHFSPRIALAASFGAPEGIVLIDLMARISRSRTRVFVIDTGRLPQQTHDLVERVRNRYDLAIEVYVPNAESIEAMAREHGPNLFYESLENRQLCCTLRKVEPFKRALAGLDGWFAGLRQGQSSARQNVSTVEIDTVNGGLVKLNPLARWTRDQVDWHVRKHQLPVNELHAEGYPSVGCDPCSRAVLPREDERAGRWWWESDPARECGIHVA